MTPQYSIIIPAYRSMDTIANLLERLVAQMEAMEATYEIIVVEDCGGDDTWAVLQSLLPKFPCLKIIKLVRNFGQHNALMCGFAQSRGELVITLDDDLQNPPEEIPKLIQKINEGFDVVYGVPARKRHSPFRNFGSYLVRGVYKRIFSSSVNLTSFRIIRRHIIQGILAYNKNFTFIDGLIAWHTTDIAEVVVRHDARGQGRSGYTVRRLLSLAMNMLTNFSIIPLQFVSVLGLASSIIGFMLAMAYLLKYLIWGVPVPGFTSIIICVTIFSGVQMLSLGLIGEYLGRIHLNVNSKPQYFIREMLPGGTADG